MSEEVKPAACEDCDRPYGPEYGFPDMVIPYDAWKQISTYGDDRGLLCPCCMIARLHARGITCAGAFMGGAVRSVDADLMYAIRSAENIELAIEGRQNAMGVALEKRIAKGAFFSQFGGLGP